MTFRSKKQHALLQPREAKQHHRTAELLRFAALCTFFAAAAPCRADLNVLPQGSRAAALGNIGVVNADVFAAYNNQAALGFLASPAAMVHYQNSYFSEALGLSAAAVAVPVPVAGVAAVDLCSFGYSQYRETRMGVGLGKQLSGRVAVGAQVCYHHISVAGYGSTGAVTAELGLLAEPLKGLWVGAHVFNFTGSRYFSPQYHERLPVMFDLGLSYRVAQYALLLADAKLDSDKPVQVRAGAELHVVKSLALRFGVQVKPVELFAGFGYAYKQLQVDVAFSRHEVMGYSPQISLCYSFKSKRRNAEL
ncbi:MAG: hypothetical protein LBS94_05915 [Prevotellaceae bacterium]|jgi:hypothetical protein|nr:hypothetical protein [Prevotellaceae bacterium]